MDNKLHYYLPHRLNVYDSDSYENMASSLIGITYPFDRDMREIIPYLYPIYCLTETINHNGVDEIPLVELAKIEGTYDFDIVYFEKTESNKTYWRLYLLNRFNKYRSSFSLHLTDNKSMSFEKTNSDNLYTSSPRNQLLLFEYCYSRRINLWNIPSIDPRTLGIENPYLK